MADSLLIEQFALSLSMMKLQKMKKLQRQAILKEVKLYIDEYLDPHKWSYRETSISAILNVLGITEDYYYWAVSISQDSDFEMHILRPPNSCFVNNYFTIGLQAIAFLTNWQCSLQEAVYQLMPEFWLRKKFTVVTFAKSNLPEKRHTICKSKDELSQLPEDSTDVFKKKPRQIYGTSE